MTWVRHLLRRVVTVTLTVALAGCGNPARIPTEEDARAVLDEAERRAPLGIDSLCTWEGVSPGRCEFEFAEMGGLAAVPREPPVVKAHCGFPADANHAAHRVLLLEGKDGKGLHYETDFVVMDAGSYGFIPQSPVYWSGVGLTQSNDSDPPKFACPQQ